MRRWWSQALGSSLIKVSSSGFRIASFELDGTRLRYTFLRGGRSIFLSYFEVNDFHPKRRLEIGGFSHFTKGR